MRTLVHLSDLHFGRIERSIVGPLTTAVAEIRPNVVAVSGDLTQRARTQEFKEARAFLDGLPSPQIIVPGNHDVPLYKILARFLRPLWKYGHYIKDDLEPFYVDEEIAVLGVNTARSLTIKGGRVNERQVARICERLGPLGSQVTKIIVSHHPFDVPASQSEGTLVRRAHMARTRLATCGVDVFLAGHLHVGRAGRTAMRPDASGRSVLVVQAGTATSTRGRGEANSFNVLRIDRADTVVERFAWHPQRRTFAVAMTTRFRRTPKGWLLISDEDGTEIDAHED